MKKKIKSTIRIVFGLALAGFLIHRVLTYSNVDIEAEFKQSIRIYLYSAFIIYGFVLLVGVYRWKLLMDVQGIKLKFFKLIQLNMIGTFFNLVIPGAVSGDFLKMYYVSTHSDGKTAEAVLTIMLDRIIGLLGLFLVASTTVLWSLDFLIEARPEIRFSAYIIGCGSIIGLISVALIYFREKLQQFIGVRHVIGILKKFSPQKVTEIIHKFISALDLYKNNFRVIIYTTLLSVVVHLLLSLSLYSIGKGFHEHNVPIKHYFLATQVANAIGAIPVTPSGFGSRDFVISLFLVDSGALKEKSGIIPPFYSIVIASWCLVGGIFFVVYRKE